MQTLIHVTTSRGGSLRDAIMSDTRLEKFGLVASEHMRPGRPHGWSKVHSSAGAHGAINIEWHAASRMLICRVVTRGGKPHSIVGDFVDYLLARHQRRILSITVVPR